MKRCRDKNAAEEGEPFAPFPDGSEPGERGADGRWLPGNPGGPGNPLAKRTAEIRQAVYDAVTAEDLRAIVKALVAQAKAGDVPAAREVLDRLLGKSVQAVKVSDAEERPALTFTFIEATPPATDTGGQGALG